MPIKPENKHRYPADWQAIRGRILERAGNRCEHEGCKARNYSVGWWARNDTGLLVWCAAWGQNDNPRTYSEARQMAAELYHERSEEGPPPIVIVLTIAHLDHQPENCADEALQPPDDRDARCCGGEDWEEAEGVDFAVQIMLAMRRIVAVH